MTGGVGRFRELSLRRRGVALAYPLRSDGQDPVDEKFFRDQRSYGESSPVSRYHFPRSAQRRAPLQADYRTGWGRWSAILCLINY